MTGDAPLLAGWAIWLLWAASWLAAAWWHGRTVASAPARATRGWLVLAALGFAGLFTRLPGRVHGVFALPGALRWACVAAILGGAAFAWWARLHLGRLWSGGIVARAGHRVIDSGPYAIVRHPIYSGVFAAALAFAALRATPLALVGAMLVIVAFASKARVEERFLAAELGDRAYARYRARVPMLLPFPRPRG